MCQPYIESATALSDIYYCMTGRAILGNIPLENDNGIFLSIA